MFNLANLCTAGNLMSGILAIILALTVDVTLAPFAIFLGLLFDFCDGFIARKLGVSGELGKQLDSLADMVTFGVAPGVIMLVILGSGYDLLNSSSAIAQNTFSTWFNNAIHFKADNYFPLAALIIPFLALFRLAKFNVDIRQSESFIGLPTPANTLFFMVFPLAIRYHDLVSDDHALYQFMYNPWFISVLIVIMSVMMVIEVPLFSLKFKQFKLKGNEIRYLFLLISLGLILVFHVWSIALIVFLYLILSGLENVFFKKNRNEI